MPKNDLLGIKFFSTRWFNLISLTQPLLENKAPEPKGKRSLTSQERLQEKINETLRASKDTSPEAQIKIIKQEISAYFNGPSFPFFANTLENRKAVIMRIIFEFRTTDEEIASLLQESYQLKPQEMLAYYKALLLQIEGQRGHKDGFIKHIIQFAIQDAEGELRSSFAQEMPQDFIYTSSPNMS